MAISGNIHSQQEFRIGIAEESSFGTPITTQADFYELHLTEAATPQDGIRRNEQKRIDGTRVWKNSDVYVSTKGEATQIQVSGVATDNTLDFLLYGVMQDLVSEGASTPFQKIFEWDDSTTQPDFTSNNGKFFTVLGNDPEGNKWSITSAILSELSLSWSPSDNDSMLTYSATFWSGFDIDRSGVTATPSSWTAFSTDNYEMPLKTRTLGGSDIVASGFDLTFNRNPQRVGHDANGDAELYYLGIPDITGTLNVLYDANTKGAIDTFRLNPIDGSAEAAVIVDWGTDDTDGHLRFDVNAIYSDQPGMSFSNEEGTYQDLSFKGVSDGTNEAVEITIANAIDRAW